MTANAQPKYRVAMALCASDSELAAKVGKFKLMNSSTLYERLEAIGYSWDLTNRSWVLKVERESAQPPVQSHAFESDSNGNILIRIMCMKGQASEVAGQLAELASLIGYKAVQISDEVPNHGSKSWVRVYITLEAL